jgi:membrane protein
MRPPRSDAAPAPIWIWSLLAAALGAALLRAAREPAHAARPAPSLRSKRSGPARKAEAQPGVIDRILASIPYATVLKDAALQWVNHNDARLGAALAYYSVFSIGPLIVIAVAVAGLVFGTTAARSEIESALQGLLGNSGAQAIDTMLTGASEPREGLIAAAIGIVTLLLAAIGVVTQLKDALNTVWETRAPKGNGFWRFIRTYLLSLAGVLAVGFLLLVSMLLTAALAAIGNLAAPMFPEGLAEAGGSLISFVIVTLLFGGIFKWLPDTPVGWRDVWSGAILTAALFEIGKFLIAFYIGKQGLESTYGAAASIVVVLIWAYYSAQIVLFGAEFTNVVAKRHARREQIRRAGAAA